MAIRDDLLRSLCLAVIVHQYDPKAADIFWHRHFFGVDNPNSFANCVCLAGEKIHLDSVAFQTCHCRFCTPQ